MGKKTGRAAPTITEKQFRLFVRECERWLAYFGVKGWRVNYECHKLDSKAEVSWNSTGRVATVTLNKEWRYSDGEPLAYTEEDIRRSAFHEALELLFANISDMLDHRIEYTRARAEAETHSIIRTLENTVFK